MRLCRLTSLLAQPALGAGLPDALCIGYPQTMCSSSMSAWPPDGSSKRAYGNRQDTPVTHSTASGVWRLALQEGSGFCANEGCSHEGCMNESSLTEVWSSRVRNLRRFAAVALVALAMEPNRPFGVSLHLRGRQRVPQGRSG
eukprot:23538-Prorocentrum_minimum.AAC.2